MKEISNLPRDLVEEVLCRIPLTSLRRVRSTCKKWNNLSKDMSFAKKHIAQAKLAAEAEGKGIMFVVGVDFRVYLMRLNLSNKNNIDESCIKPEAKLIGPDGSGEIDVCQVVHCDGLLLCITISRLVVWNPYWGQTRWIEANIWDRSDTYALGYDMSSNSHKILRLLYPVKTVSLELKIYEFNSDSWRVLDVPPRDWVIFNCSRCVSLKGNTYWFAAKKREYFLVCFDFTRETFGARLALPFQALREDTVSLSSVREEQLAVLFQPIDTLQMELWVTTKVEPDAVSWSSKVFLSANIKQLIHPKWQFQTATTSFFIDEEKKAAVVFDKDRNYPTRNVAYIIGVDGSLKEEDVRESTSRFCRVLGISYVPSLVQLN